MTVRVAGFGNAVRIDFEDVFVKADERYQMIQRIYKSISRALENHICGDLVEGMNIRLILGTPEPLMRPQSRGRWH